MPDRPPRRARPTARGAGLAGAGLLAVLASRGFGSPALLPVGVGFLVVSAAALAVVALAASRLRVSRTVTTSRPVAGDPLEAAVRVDGRGAARLALRALEWDVDPGLAQLGQVRRGRPTDGVVRATVARTRRGEHVLPPPTVRLADPFGLATAGTAGVGGERVLAVPVTVPAAERTSALGGRRRGHAALAGEDVSSLEGLREYRPGDPLSRVHWGQSAKRGRLHTKLFRPDDGGGRISVVLLDAGPGAVEADAELAVSAAASLARAACGGGRAGSLRLWCSGEPAPRECPWPEAEARLARVVMGEGRPLEETLTRAARLLPPSTGIVAVTAVPHGAGLIEAVRAARRGGLDLVLVAAGAASRGDGLAAAGVPVVAIPDVAALPLALRPAVPHRAVIRA